MQLTAKEIIKQEYGANSRNFMTPQIVSYGLILDTDRKQIAYEISRERKFDNPLYGLSVVSYDPVTDKTLRLTEESIGMISREAVREEIKDLKKKYRLEKTIQQFTDLHVKEVRA